SCCEFGFYPFIIGTLRVTCIAMLIALPICFLAAIYVAEYAKGRIRAVVNSMIDLLAGVPSVVIGVWGVLAIVPIIKVVGIAAGQATTGYSVLAGGIVLAIMVFPSIISVSQEVLRSVPVSMREASFALGATKWQTVKHVVVRKSLPGIIAAMILGFSRAFGETIAVLMVVGNVPRIPSSIFQPAYPLPALIANNYEDVMSIPLYDSALLFAALLLLLVVAGFTLFGRLVLVRLQRRSSSQSVDDYSDLKWRFLSRGSRGHLKRHRRITISNFCIDLPCICDRSACCIVLERIRGKEQICGFRSVMS